MSDTFIHLSNSYIKSEVKRMRALGMSEDDIFDALYCQDCNLDEENEVD